MTVIAALWNPDGGPAGPACEAMLRAQSPHGWPEKVRSDGSAAVGCAAPAAPGPAGERAPQGRASGGFLLAADIRLDNREDFLPQLGLRGADAESLPDPRLMLLCFERWGLEVIERFVGDFAVALWDKRGQRLVLARDYAGQRPLHYHESRRGVAASSMAKGLFALDYLQRAVDEVRLLEMLAAVHHEGPGTFFKQVRRVEPGELLIFGPGGRSSRIFWTAPTTEIRLGSHGEYAEALREKLDMAVEAQLRGAGSAVATHLSAGLDSSAVTSAAAILFPGRVLAFTSVPPDHRSALPRGRFGSEGALAARTASLYPNVEHRLVETPGRLPLEDLDWELDLFERPDINLPNLAWANRINDAVAAEGVNVLLVGTTGNLSISYAGGERLGELLARGQLRGFLSECAAARRHGMRPRALLGMAAHQLLPRAIVRVLGPLRDRRGHPAAAGVLNPEAPGVADILARHGRYDDPSAAGSVRSRAHMLGRVDPGTYNKGLLLRWNIDVRDPTVDRRLFEFCLGVPLAHYFRNGTPRALVRTALEGRVPDEVRLETLRGLQSPHWLEMISSARGEAGRLLERIGESPLACRLLDIAKMRRLLGEWPDPGIAPPPPVYRSGLIRGLAAGEFIRANSAVAPAPRQSIDARAATP
ncbi:MAG TPA: asparagine synthase-related protein [Allosphingosinicella sp.]|nr:asparagine synthase-related protein [Allosphingosinicella sp.]